MPWECLNTSNTKQILDTDLLKTVLGHVAWNPTKSAEPFQWCVLALNSWIADFVNIILSWKEQLSLTCLPCSVARHLALFDKSKSREKESFDRSTRSIGIPEQLWSCGRIWTLDKGKHYSYSVLMLSLVLCFISWLCFEQWHERDVWSGKSGFIGGATNSLYFHLCLAAAKNQSQCDCNRAINDLAWFLRISCFKFGILRPWSSHLANFLLNNLVGTLSYIYTGCPKKMSLSEFVVIAASAAWF